jgi:hypothetical protein
MKREGKIHGIATSKKRQRGKCRCVGCSMCHIGRPCSKSLKKCKGRTKEKKNDLNWKNNL